MSDVNGRTPAQSAAGRFLGSLKDALQAAGRADLQQAVELPEATQRTLRPAPTTAPPQAASASVAASGPPPVPQVAPSPALPDTEAAVRAEPIVAPPADLSVPPTAPAVPQVEPPLSPPVPSAAEAAREARGRAPRQSDADHHLEFNEPVTRVIRPNHRPAAPTPAESAPRTQVLRGRQSVTRGEFKQDPVVGWLVVVGGSGLGSFRPVFEGNNSIGRGPGNRVAIDFGDEAISSSEQAYIRYDSNDRSFLLVPNLAKTNVVALNDKRPTSAVPLAAMDVITMGRTQLVFVPFCGPDFDWSELGELRG